MRTRTSNRPRHLSSIITLALATALSVGCSGSKGGTDNDTGAGSGTDTGNPETHTAPQTDEVAGDVFNCEDPRVISGQDALDIVFTDAFEEADGSTTIEIEFAAPIDVDGELSGAHAWAVQTTMTFIQDGAASGDTSFTASIQEVDGESLGVTISTSGGGGEMRPDLNVEFDGSFVRFVDLPSQPLDQMFSLISYSVYQPDPDGPAGCDQAMSLFMLAR